MFSRLRAEVSSLAAPNTLHYVTEQRVLKGKYSLYFDCDLFTDKYIEYCFVYVSQAITGAVTDVREDCVPTIPVTGMYRNFFFKILKRKGKIDGEGRVKEANEEALKEK